MAFGSAVTVDKFKNRLDYFFVQFNGNVRVAVVAGAGARNIEPILKADETELTSSGPAVAADKP